MEEFDDYLALSPGTGDLDYGNSQDYEKDTEFANPEFARLQKAHPKTQKVKSSEQKQKESLTKQHYRDIVASEVSNYPCLYRKQHPDYRNKVKRDVVWQKIAETTGISVVEAKKFWTAAKDRDRHQRKKIDISKQTNVVAKKSKKGKSGAAYVTSSDAESDVDMRQADPETVGKVSSKIKKVELSKQRGVTSKISNKGNTKTDYTTSSDSEFENEIPPVNVKPVGKALSRKRTRDMIAEESENDLEIMDTTDSVPEKRGTGILDFMNENMSENQRSTLSLGGNQKRTPGTSQLSGTYSYMDKLKPKKLKEDPLVDVMMTLTDTMQTAVSKKSTQKHDGFFKEVDTMFSYLGIILEIW